MSTGKSLKFDDNNAEQMRAIENAVARTLAPFHETTEAALAIFALVRCARMLLYLYPSTTRAELLPVLTAFLEGKQTAPGAEPSLIRLQYKPDIFAATYDAESLEK